MLEERHPSAFVFLPFRGVLADERKLGLNFRLNVGGHHLEPEEDSWMRESGDVFGTAALALRVGSSGAAPLAALASASSTPSAGIEATGVTSTFTTSIVLISA